MDAAITNQPGNTPLRDIPQDYYPESKGRWFVLPNGIDAGKKLFFYDHVFGKGEPLATVVLVHGNPENSYTHRKVIAEMARSAMGAFRVVDMDHIGFGLSDQATFEMVDMHHAANFIQLIRHLSLEDITLVVHDWGGPIGIGALLEDPDRVKNLLVLNTTVFPIPKDGMTYENYPHPIVPWCKFPERLPDFLWGAHSSYCILNKPFKNILPALARYGLYMVRVLSGRLPAQEKEAQRVFIDQFKPKMNARSSQRMVLQTPVWGHGYVYKDPTIGAQDNRTFYKMIQNRISKVWGPQGKNIGVRALFGKWDPLARQTVINQWITALPQLEEKVQTFDMTSHFIEEFRPVEIAKAIFDLISRQ